MITIVVKIPSTSTFMALRGETDWGIPDKELCRTALENSICGVVAYEKDMAIGMVRVVGDGVLNLYIQDMIVHKSYRNQGVGSQLLSVLIENLQANFPSDITVGLMAAKGHSAFYNAFGFSPRPSANFGAGMSANLRALTASQF